MLYEFVENLITGPHLRGFDDSAQVTIVGKFIRKTERAGGNALFNRYKVLACAAQVGFRRCLQQRRAIARAVKLEVELDSVSVFDRDSAGHRFSAHADTSAHGGWSKQTSRTRVKSRTIVTLTL